MAVLVFRSDRGKDAELLVLRHQNAVPRRNASRVRYRPGDRVRSAALARVLPRRRWTDVLPVTPATLAGQGNISRGAGLSGQVAPARTFSSPSRGDAGKPGRRASVRIGTTSNTPLVAAAP